MAVKVSRVLHAGYIFESKGTRILFDPIFENPFSRNCYAFPTVEFDVDQIRQEKFEAVFISHYHDDHCSFDSLKLIDRQTPVYIFCIFDEMIQMLHQLGFAFVHQLRLNEAILVGDFLVTPRRALDEDVDSIYQIEVQGCKILNVVDSWIDYETLDMLVAEGPWDLVLWPFQTMRELEVIAPDAFASSDGKLPPEWIEQLVRINPRNLIPSSCQFRMEEWSWYNKAFFPISYTGFEQQVQAVLPKTKTFRLNPGRTIEIRALTDVQRLSPNESAQITSTGVIPWIRTVGNQNVDYEYDREVLASTTSEIAKKFPALSAAQTERVLQYCEKDILKCYQDLSETDFFAASRIWKLILHDQSGSSRSWIYSLEGPTIELQKEELDPVWTTEVPIQRLWGALEEGESLTSMYIRVHPAKDADILEDPLIRCLYNGSFGEYQKAQLKRASRP